MTYLVPAFTSLGCASGNLRDLVIWDVQYIQKTAVRDNQHTKFAHYVDKSIMHHIHPVEPDFLKILEEIARSAQLIDMVLEGHTLDRASAETTSARFCFAELQAASIHSSIDKINDGSSA
jgi:hypothetical protein